MNSHQECGQTALRRKSVTSTALYARCLLPANGLIALSGVTRLPLFFMARARGKAPIHRYPTAFPPIEIHQRLMRGLTGRMRNKFRYPLAERKTPTLSILRHNRSHLTADVFTHRLKVVQWSRSEKLDLDRLHRNRQ